MPGDWRTLEPSLWRRCLEVNLTGVFTCVQVFGPILARTGRGRIVNIGSTYAGMGVGVIAAYAAAKAGVASLTALFAKDLAPEVTVNLVAPGNIDTAMTRSAGPEFVDSVIAGTPLGRLGSRGRLRSGSVSGLPGGFVHHWADCRVGCGACAQVAGSARRR
jgi:3-oxoacyl-[acyl-carrier protein] reductase